MSNEAGVFKDSQNMQRLCLKRFTQCILGHLNQYLSVQRLVNIKLILSFWGKVSSYRLCIYILFKRKSKTSLRNAASFSNWQHNVCLLQSKSVWWSKSSKSSEDPTAVLLHYRIKCALQPAGKVGLFFWLHQTFETQSLCYHCGQDSLPLSHLPRILLYSQIASLGGNLS